MIAVVTQNRPKPIQLESLRPAKMWFRLASSPVANTRVTWMTMKNRNQTRTRKCSDRATWMDSTRLTGLIRVDSAGDMPSPVISASGAATNTVTKYASSCRLL